MTMPDSGYGVTWNMGGSRYVRPQKKAPMNQFIVGEVSKNWIDGVSLEPGLLCQQFEAMIERNRTRGYRLHSFSLHRQMTKPLELNETIIAVFERSDPEP